MGGAVSALALLLLPTLSEGPMARAELSFAREASAEAGPGGRELELLVEAAGSHLRQALAATPGLRVEAGCGSVRCRLVVDGLSPGVGAALPNLLRASSDAAPALRPRQARESRRWWRGAWRRPSVVLDAAVSRIGGNVAPPLSRRPDFHGERLRRAWREAWLQDPRLVVAGEFDEAAVVALAGSATNSPVPSPLAARPETGASAAAPPIAAALPLLVVDSPGSSRAQLALVWQTDPDGAIRDQALAGDFESRLVQSLREHSAYTYDVSLELAGDRAAATWDARPEFAWDSLAAALAELWEQARQDGPTARTAAWRRAQLGRVLLADTLAGRIAVSSLARAPEAPAGPFRTPKVLGAAVVADAEALTGEWAALGADRIDRCGLLYGDGCPPGS